MENKPVTIPVPLQARSSQRASERFGAVMPITVDGVEGTTTDLSRTGLSFVATRSYEPGARINVVIEYLLDGHQYPLHCEAEVVRVEPSAGGYRIGARLSAQSELTEVAVPLAVEEDPIRRHLRPID